MNVIRRLETLRRAEHASTVEIVRALVVCNRERAYVELGYSSLWAYLIEELKYSQAAASRRYRAMKCAAEFPQVIVMLRNHRVSLSSLAKVEALLRTVEDPAGLLEEICGKSQVQVERIVAARQPMNERPREVVKRAFVKACSAAGFGSGLFDAAPACESSGRTTSTAEESPPTVDSAANPGFSATSAAEVEGRAVGARAAALEERVTLRTSLTAERYEALERARAIYSRKNPAATVEDLLNELVDHYLAAKAPKVRRKAADRQIAMQAGAAAAGERPAGRRDANAESGDASPRSRHIPAAIRDEVMLRDGERCTFLSRSGHRCTATCNLQIDHIRPFALGGEHTVENLRVLCATHNRHEARKVFGNRTVSGRRSTGRSRVAKE